MAGVNMSRQQKKRKTRLRTDRQRLQMEKKQLTDAKQKIADAKAEIKKIENPKWYVQTREDALTE